MIIRSQGTIRSGVAAALASLLLLPGEAGSQTQPEGISPVTLGSKVRLWAPTVVKGRLEGTVVESDEKSLVVGRDDRMPVRVSRQSITQLQLNTGRQRKALKGMLIGAGIGAALFQVTVSDNGNCQNAITVCTTSRGQAAGLGLAVGAAWGAGIGALIKRDRWSTVPLERVALSLGPTRGRGMGLSVSVGF